MLLLIRMMMMIGIMMKTIMTAETDEENKEQTNEDSGVNKDACNGDGISEQLTRQRHTVTCWERPPVGKSLQREAFPSISNRVA